VTKGAALAKIANCNTCHTAEGGRPYAGGRPLKTPYGTIYGTNITPDPDTGIGRWPEEAFVRALREGVSREGRHLYPAFPYDHYAIMPDEDIRALYAFMMTRDPVPNGVPPNDLRFPFNIRMLVAAWKALYFDPALPASDPTQSAEWNRGAYLVEGPAHCGSCHTPRNLLGAEKKRRHLAGGEAEGWHAPAINAASPSALPWSAEALYEYLRYGHAGKHPVAAGPMAEVVRNLSTAPEQEVRAIAAFIASFTGQDTAESRQRAAQVLARVESDSKARAGEAAAPEPQRAAAQGPAGRGIYAGACASCHDSGRLAGSSGTALHLALSSSVHLPTPGNVIRIILDGISPPEGERGRMMPGFAGALTDEQVVALARYLRSDFAKGPPWRDIEDEVRKARRERERKLATVEAQ
jgi:mono/diheme cytochrome c family protein